MIVWDAFTTHKQNAIHLRSSWVMTCAYAPSGNMVACGGTENICRVYRTNRDEDAVPMPKELIGHEEYISCCRFVDDRQILTASGDNTCMLWDIEEGVAVTKFQGHTADVISLSESRDGNTMVTGGCDYLAKVWDLRTGKNTQTFAGHDADINSVKFFATGESFVTGSDDSSCRLFDLRSDRELNRYYHKQILYGVTGVDFSLSGRLLFAGYDDYNINIWDTLRAERVGHIPAHDTHVSCLNVSSDGMALATGAFDSYIKIWA
eukprot:Colp12_sorted_trinity150504_noHs@22326